MVVDEESDSENNDVKFLLMKESKKGKCFWLRQLENYKKMVWLPSDKTCYFFWVSNKCLLKNNSISLKLTYQNSTVYKPKTLVQFILKHLRYKKFNIHLKINTN